MKKPLMPEAFDDAETQRRRDAALLRALDGRRKNRALGDVTQERLSNAG